MSAVVLLFVDEALTLLRQNGLAESSRSNGSFQDHLQPSLQSQRALAGIIVEAAAQLSEARKLSAPHSEADEGTIQAIAS